MMNIYHRSTFRNLKHREACLLQEPLSLKSLSIRSFFYTFSLRIFILVVKLIAPKLAKEKLSKVEEFNYTLF